MLTTLRILEGKGYVRHTKEGRAFVYEPVVVQEEASRKALDYLVNRFFGGSCELLVMNLLKEETIGPAELRRIKKMIAESEKGGQEMTHVNFAMTTLLNGIWEGTFLAVAMWLFLRLLPRLNPTTRFTVLVGNLTRHRSVASWNFHAKSVHSRRANDFASCSDKQSHDHDSDTR